MCELWGRSGDRYADSGPRPDADTTPAVSVVIPCLNEAETIEACVIRAREALDGRWAPRRGDRRRQRLRRRQRRRSRAQRARRVIDEPRRGYGSAYLAGFAAARGDYIVMIDADLTYDFDEIPRFVSELDDGARTGDRRPDGEHPAGRDVGHEPDRESDSERLPEPPPPHAGERRPLRPARASAATRWPRSICTRPAWSSPPRW